MLNPVVAIDGPAASGKSTVARKLAALLNFTYVDTGAMYRAFAWLALEQNLDPADRVSVSGLVECVKFDLTVSGGAVRMALDGTDPAPFIRSERINAAVSKIAAIPELRERLVIEQRKLRNLAPLVMEGRDIGTVVFTDTAFKFFLDADPAIRASRRRQQGQTDAVAARDQADAARAAAPLTMAADAIPVDATYNDADQIAAKILQICRDRGLSAAKVEAL
ncbi:MAG: (d)CMP kinase [Verrucomicrobiales bacterium]|jgi:cytidylate kinase|nr:(d)CMP kinase [Verrucomicrobiales bacterium]